LGLQEVDIALVAAMGAGAFAVVVLDLAEGSFFIDEVALEVLAGLRDLG
jgi:hypothetical protein